jgi:hypothetical protein
MKQPQRRGAVGGVQAVLLAGHVIVNVVASAFVTAVEPVSFSHNCVHSDEFTTVDLDSGTEQVGITQGGPGLNPAGTSAGTQLWKSSKSLQFQLVRFGGEGRNRPDFLAVAPPICLISLGIQAKSVLSARIVFNPFGVRFGVRLPISNL